jgi:hypothetical protein
MLTILKKSKLHAKPVRARRPHFRERNKVSYRFAHWPIWIFVFFMIPGPLMFDLMERGFDRRIVIWLLAVMVATGSAGLRGKLPGVEPKPYILRFTEDKPNPLYRRICYTAAWSDLISFCLMHLAGLTYAVATGSWHLKQIYNRAYLPIMLTVLICGVLGWLPRVKASTKGEGTERRYFYGTVWSAVIAQSVLCLLWKILPRTPSADAWKLTVFVTVLSGVAFLAWRGRLPRTRAIVPGEWAISD